MRLLASCILLMLVSNAFAEKRDNAEKIIYRYKDYEKFDFSEIGVEGDKGIPGDLSVITRDQKAFKNKLPYRKNFNPEIRKSVEMAL